MSMSMFFALITSCGHALLTFISAILLPTVPERPTLPAPAAVVTHANQKPAGTLKDGKLRLNLRAGEGLWRPELAGGPALSIEAFGEIDGPLVAPAPLIRVPEGTEIIATVRNDLAAPLQVHGLCEHNGSACTPFEVPASGTRTVTFRSGRAGTYLWWASTTGVPLRVRYSRDSQLSGAFVVDPANATPERDRVFVVTEWTSLTQKQLREAMDADDPFMAAIAFQPKFATLINGLSWPHTERLTYHVGDTVKWRIVNASAEDHPLHLHGFYFDVDSLGDDTRETRFRDDQKPRVVTQLLRPGGTLALTWTPERVGNWLFHCHIIEHVSPDRRLTEARPADASHEHHGHDTPAGMAGMVLGISVLAREGEDAKPSALDTTNDPSIGARQMMLTMRSAPKPNSKTPTYGFVLEGSQGQADAAPKVPGPTLVLKRGEPVAITLKNELPEATAVHWHGMEVDSYYDGVHGFGGMDGRTTPLIEPGGTFTVRFTPPRTGTFIYHTHMHDDRQLTSGLYGALLVTDPAEAHDPAIDHPMVLGRDGVAQPQMLVLNGAREPQFSWRAGQRHRLRFVNITRHDVVQVSLMSAAGPVSWRPLTKDGAPVPSGSASARPASQVIAVGETYDFEYDAPASRHELWIEVKGESGRWLAQGHAVLK
jgi:FtsP/CotA-like multicopper oxidase with cupredoxin domain